MAVTPAQLLAPQGDLEASLFPGEATDALNMRLQGYISEGEARTSDDAAVRAWAYHRAFHAVYIRLTTTPHQVSFEDQGGHSYLMSQIENVYNLSRRYLEEFNALVGTDAPGVVSRTESRRADFTW